MDPTTLVTFIFRAPPQVRTVELIGSWDNFSQPYRMQHDSRRGRGVWTGCFRFKDIVFDGDRPQWTRPRTGGLKQGGTYWFYYRLDDDIETYDDRLAYTAACPLMPGQAMNVLHVPCELVELPSSRRSVSTDADACLARTRSVHTLEPGDKFAALEPPPISRVHDRCVSDIALNGRLEHAARAILITPVSPSGASCHQRLLPMQAELFADREDAVGMNDSLPSTSSSYSSRCAAASSVFDAECVNDSQVELSDPLTRIDLDSQHVYDAIASLVDTPQMPSRPYSAHSIDNRPSTAHGLDWALASKTASPSFGDINFQSSGTQSTSGWSPMHCADPWESKPGDLTVSSAKAVSPRLPCSPAVYDLLNFHGHDPSSDNRLQAEEADVHAAEPAYELCSPTFSAATVSSNGGGVNTPWRLSFGITRSYSTTTPAGINETASMARIADRLRSLSAHSPSGNSSSGSGSGSHPAPAFLPPLAPGSTSFASYSLPQVAEESLSSLGKSSVPSRRDSFGGNDAAIPRTMAAPFRAPPPPPPPARPPPFPPGSLHAPLPAPLVLPGLPQLVPAVMMAGGLLPAPGEAPDRSFADSIFTELGYLGGCIS